MFEVGQVVRYMATYYRVQSIDLDRNILILNLGYGLLQTAIYDGMLRKNIVEVSIDNPFLTMF
jgi:hypothetical protein